MCMALLIVERGRVCLEASKANLPLFNYTYIEMTLYIIYVLSLCARYGLVGLCVRYGRQAQANLSGHLFLSGGTDGVGVLATKTGEYSAVLKIENPVQKIFGGHR